MKPVAIIDTNILVAGILTGDSRSPVCQIVDGMLTGQFPFVLSPALLAEYRRVLLRPRIRAYHRWTIEEIDIFLEEIVASAIWCEPSGQHQAPDPGDDHLWRLLHECKGTVLITGDRLLLRQAEALPILTARDFVSRFLDNTTPH